MVKMKHLVIEPTFQNPVFCMGKGEGLRWFSKAMGRVSEVIHVEFHRITLPKTNMSPENWWLEDEFPIEVVPF